MVHIDLFDVELSFTFTQLVALKEVSEFLVILSTHIFVTYITVKYALLYHSLLNI